MVKVKIIKVSRVAMLVLVLVKSDLGSELEIVN